jgi:hypothetical protein
MHQVQPTSPVGGYKISPEVIPPPGLNEQSDKDEQRIFSKMPKQRRRSAKKLKARRETQSENRQNA